MLVGVRKAMLSVAVGLAGVAAVLALGLGLQSAVLPTPERSDRIAAEASHWLGKYRYSIDIFHSDRQRLDGACLRGWYPRHKGARALKRGSLLVLRHGPVVLATGGRRHIRVLSGSHRRDLPVFLAIATGCTAPLGHLLYAAAQGSTEINVERAFAANQPALALQMPNVHDGRLTVYVSPRQYRPLVAIASAEGHTITARIYLSRATLHLRLHYRQLLNNGMRRRSGGAA
jgi:hypothetical protein